VCWCRCPKIRSSSIDCTQVSSFYLKIEAKHNDCIETKRRCIWDRSAYLHSQVTYRYEAWRLINSWNSRRYILSWMRRDIYSCINAHSQYTNHLLLLTKTQHSAQILLFVCSVRFSQSTATFPKTALTGWALYRRRNVFPVGYGVNSCILFTKSPLIRFQESLHVWLYITELCTTPATSRIVAVSRPDKVIAFYQFT
jgi:hypothetical protein